MNQGLLASPTLTKICRICFDHDNEKELISPCLCTGGSAYVHRNCLDKWRSVNKNGRAFKFCAVCRFEYVIEPVIDDPSADKQRLLKFRLLMARDLTLIILLVQAIIVGMAVLLQRADKANHRTQDLSLASTKSFGIYYLISIILFLALLGLLGLLSLCCGLTENEDYDRRTCGGYYCYSSQCQDCTRNRNSDGGGGRGGREILMVAAVIILIFAVIGVFVGIMLSWIIVEKRMKRHTARLWLREETKKYVVRDFQGRRHELGTLARTLPSAPEVCGASISVAPWGRPRVFRPTRSARARGALFRILPRSPTPRTEKSSHSPA